MNNDFNMSNCSAYHNICSNGGGIELRRTVLYEDFALNDNCNVFTESEGDDLYPSNQLYEPVCCFPRQTAMKVYDVYIDGRDEHNGVMGRDNGQVQSSKVIMQILNKQCYDEENWDHMTYILGNIDQITGYYLLWPGDYGLDYTLKHCAHPPEGYLEVIDVVNCTMSKILAATNHRILNSDVDHNPKLAYDNYCKDQQVWQHYQCDYVTYVTNIIDELIGKANSQITDQGDTHDKSFNEHIAHQGTHEAMPTYSNEFKTTPQKILT